MILIFFLSKMVKQKRLENKRNMIKVRIIDRNALAIGNTSNIAMEIDIDINIFTMKTTAKSSYRPSILI